MTAWGEIKAEMTKHKPQKSLGYALAVYSAAQIFVRILPYLRAQKTARAAFVADAEVTDAMLNGRTFESLRL
jgi:hypothetical protein